MHLDIYCNKHINCIKYDFKCCTSLQYSYVNTTPQIMNKIMDWTHDNSIPPWYYLSRCQIKWWASITFSSLSTNTRKTPAKPCCWSHHNLCHNERKLIKLREYTSKMLGCIFCRFFFFLKEIMQITEYQSEDKDQFLPSENTYSY